MKSKVIFSLFLILGFLCCKQSCFGTGSIYDETNSTIFIGGYPLENERLSWNPRVGSLPLLHKIYSVNFEKREQYKIFETDNDKIMAYNINNNGLIAVSTHNANEQKGINEKQLFILEKNGKIIKKFKNTVNSINKGFFSWSPDGQKIAYVTGKSIIEGHLPFEAQGVFIYDIKKDETVKISDKGADVYWSEHDKNIYIRDNFIQEDPQNISVYNTTNKQLIKSNRHGTIFSDDGKFYIGAEIDKTFEGDGNMLIYFIYDNKTNEKIFKFTGSEGYNIEVASEVFFLKKTHCLMIRYPSLYFIFDVDKKKTIKKLNAGLIGFNKDMTKAVVYEGKEDFINIIFTMEGIKIKSIKIP
ncbi:MAG: hypothetical protein EHM45_14695 [Desulfobacteraceae bacterium]|nr:MAG: hypothetical protein EHM45_14695 [Desulfobacteraceae bacterium]